MPVHGEYRMLKLHADIAVECGMPKENTFVMENGDVLTLINKKAIRSGQVPADSIYIDGKNTSGISTSVIKDRTMLISEGVVGVFLIINPKTNKLIRMPQVISKGFISSNKKAIQKKAAEVINLEVTRLMESSHFWSRF